MRKTVKSPGNPLPLKTIILSVSSEISELKELMRSLGMDAEGVFIQNREPHPRTFLGSGKIEEVREYLEERPDIEAAVVNGELTSAQMYYLEKKLGIRVYDRIRLILDIFTMNAHSSEAKLQVELAELNYQIPFLREWIHAAKKGEHPGFMAGGEYALDDYYLMIKRRMVKIKKELKDIRRDRENKRRSRRKKGYYLVAVTGYTNAGKSALLNALSGENILVEDRMFSTLSTTTRRIDSDKKILITDTVGFIRDLPPWLIEAFRATMEEVFEADAVIILLDASESPEIMKEKLKASEEIIFPDIEGTPLILALNKIDLISPEELETKKMETDSGRYRAVLPISATLGKNTRMLVEEIENILTDRVSLGLILPNSAESESFVSWLYDNTKVLSVERSSVIKIETDCREYLRGKAEKKAAELSGRTYLRKAEESAGKIYK